MITHNSIGFYRYYKNNLIALIIFCTLFIPHPYNALASDSDQWWNTDWPYRIPVNVNGIGVTEVTINFTETLDALGVDKGLIDIRSIRVIPYNNQLPGSSIAYAETYSVMLEDADNPQIGWSDDGVYWQVNNGSAVADSSRYSEGAGSLKAIVENVTGGYGYPGVELKIAQGGLTDWRGYESLIYDVWPEVNASAIDQAPDLYSFKLYNTEGCPTSNITQGGPPLALNRWNFTSVSLSPFHTCTTPNFSNISRIEFHTRDNVTVNGNSGLYDDGDLLTLWFDNVRLVDQDAGTVQWFADGTTSKYYIYFDTLVHEGHPQPQLTNFETVTLAGTAESPETGGYYHKISGSSPGNLQIWTMPAIEKVGKTLAIPTIASPLVISAARNEFEPFQIIVQSPSEQSLPVTITAFSKSGDIIPVSNITLHRVDYVTILQLSDHFGRLGETPDPLYPLVLGAEITFSANTNQSIWFTVEVPRDASPGIYNSTVQIGSAVVPVQLEVWDFTLPDEIHLASEWGFSWTSIVEEYKGTDGGVQPCYWNLVDAIYEDFADHRLTPKGVGWPAGLSFDYNCDTGVLDVIQDGNVWYFDSTADKYLTGNELDNSTGFPTFLIKGPASNWPPASRPSSFCGMDRGTDPPGSPVYNTKWFQYWSEVDKYLGETSDYAQKGYYHIVNEPQTFDDYDIVAYLAQKTKAVAPNVRIMVSEQVESAIFANTSYPNAKIDIWMPTISNYEVTKSQDRQKNHGEEVWWYFLYGDRPPLPNPTVIDRTGIEARITPWLAWMERVDGLLYYSITDWNPDPWTATWSNNSCNGDAVMIYSPKDNSIAFDACNAQSNRLVPSIRWELLREGMEDYEYLWLLINGDPKIDVVNIADSLASRFVSSRTLYSRVPTDLYKTRRAIAAQLEAGLAEAITALKICAGLTPPVANLIDIDNDDLLGLAEAIYYLQYAVQDR